MSAVSPTLEVGTRWNRFVRPQDFVWLLLFSALHVVSPVRNSAELELLIALALFQVLEPRVKFLNTPRGNLVSISVKLLLGYLLMGVTFGLESSYYLILLLPVVSAATTLGGLGTLAVTLLACASYLSYLLFVDWTRNVIPPDQVSEISLRVIFLALVGYFTHQLAEANRVEAKRYQAAAEQLAAANTSLQEAEAAMRRADRLAALGQLTAGLAHELRNPLGTMKNSAEMLAREVPPDSAIARELAGFISSEVDRANSLVTRFLEFARPFPLRLEPAELADVIDRAVAQLERHNPPFDVAIYKNYSPDIQPFAFDAEMMEQVFTNLLVNAAEATPPGGAVTVKTRPVTGGVEIAVIDRGAGIDPKHMESIFNPFFTTKPNGVGLGLAVVSKIVDEHGGRIAVESEPGEGTVFRVLLPAG